MITTFMRQLRTLLLGMWLGAAIFFGASVAPALFGVLRGAGLGNANEVAGSIVTRLLSFLNKGGFEIALFALVTAFFVSRNRKLVLRIGEVLSLAIMAIMTGVSQWIITARMVALRAAMNGTIDQVPFSDPRRIEFDSLHRYSTTVMMVAMLAGLIAFFITSSSSMRAAKTNSSS
jgi:prepilin signal peptidase PulO-like enzyme (type II secretory pathway)